MSQRGSVRQRGTTWTCYWFTTDPDGARRQRSRGGFRLKRDAQAHLTTVLGEIQAGSYVEPEDRKITLGRFLDDHWLPAVRTEATKSGAVRRASTVESYEIAVRAWIKPWIGGERLVGLTPSRVERWHAELRTGGGKAGRPLGDRGTQYAATVLRQALDHAVRRGHVTRNVAAVVGRPGARATEMAFWSAAEAQTFLAAIAGERLYAGWLLLLARGLRRGELAGLRWTEVDLDNGSLRIVNARVSVGGRVVEGPPKTAAGRRTIPLDPGLVRVLKAHRLAQLEARVAWGPAWQESGYVFVREDGAPPRPEYFSDRFEQLCRDAGVRRIRLHDLRHTAATLMLADGTSVKVAQELLGHSSPAITQSFYAHVLPGMAEDAGQRLSDRLLGQDC